MCGNFIPGIKTAKRKTACNMGKIIRNPDKGCYVIIRYFCCIIIIKRTEHMKKMNSVVKVLLLSVSASLLAPPHPRRLRQMPWRKAEMLMKLR